MSASPIYTRHFVQPLGHTDANKLAVTGKKSWTSSMTLSGKNYTYINLDSVASTYGKDLRTLPYCIRVLIESVARNQSDEITAGDVESLICWNADAPSGVVPFKPARIVLQDFTGVPTVVDLAAMRDALNVLGADPQDINPEIPVTLVVDHSVQVDCAGSQMALAINTKREFERNTERYTFLKWAQRSFRDFNVVPPETGIIHQVNIEVLSDVVMTKNEGTRTWLLPDTLQGTDSHTTMINGLGVLGWGVGGIEAEAAILGEASYFPTPEVVGVRFVGSLTTGCTATDVALTVTERLRQEKVVGKFVEFFGPGYANLTLSDRATVANMAPEYGATCGFCPIDEETINYLHLTGRSPDVIERVTQYAQANHLFLDPTHEPTYTTVVTIDLGAIHPALAGPKRPQDRILLPDMADDFTASLTKPVGPKGFGLDSAELRHAHLDWNDGASTPVTDANASEKTSQASENTLESERPRPATLTTGDIVLAAITSCTNTSNPYVMIAAGLLARNAVERGLQVPASIKTSLAPGSRTVTTYLKKSGLHKYLDLLGFNLVGYGCTTCIGNSGPLDEVVAHAIESENLLVASVLSGNRNFEGRIHPLIKANYLASPPLVIAYALAGSIRVNLMTDPLGVGINGQNVMLADIWPTPEEITAYMHKYVRPEAFSSAYSQLFDANERWNNIETTHSSCYNWVSSSTYIANPPFFEGLSLDESVATSLDDLRVLVKVADSVTTDHISPAGAITPDSPAGLYLKSLGIERRNFNSFGSRRGNHEIMMRGTFGNIRLQNQLTPDHSGSATIHWPTGEIVSIYDAAMRYKKAGIGSIVLAGKDYGMGSSRDWAAKGPQLLGVRAVIAESFERIHRSNLAMMGIVPLQYQPGDNAETLGLDGSESFTIDLPDQPKVGQTVTVQATRITGESVDFSVRLRFDSPADIRYWRNGGILPMVIRKKCGKDM